MQLLLGIKGIKRSGKDTVANLLIKEFGFKRISFADALYQEVAELFGVTTDFLRKDATKEKPLKELELSKILSKDKGFVAHCISKSRMYLTHMYSPRIMLQQYGDYKRVSVSEQYWSEQVFNEIKTNPTQHYCIADVRYKNEYALVEAHNGTMVEVYCEPIYNKWYEAYKQGKPEATHISETDLMNHKPKIQLTNVWGDMNALHEQVRQLMKTLL